MTKKRVLVIDSIHVGSHVSVMPPTVELPTGEVIVANDLQKIIFLRWMEMCGKGPYDAVIIAGETVDGDDRRGKGYTKWSTDIRVQVNVATKLLKMIPTKKYYGVNGSPYHVGQNMSADQACVELGLGGTFAPSELFIDVGGKIFHVSHKIGGSSTFHKASSLNNEMTFAKLHEDVYGKIDVIIRGHRHSYIQIADAKHIGMVIPAWKARDDFSASHTLNYTPELGYVIFEVEDGKIDFDATIFTIEKEPTTDVV